MSEAAIKDALTNDQADKPKKLVALCVDDDFDLIISDYRMPVNG